jgi:4-hydroxy-tetrahydrodipicolinate reductase
MSEINIAISGAAGRMGQRLIDLGSQDPALKVIAAIDHPDHSQVGTDAGMHAGIGNIGVSISPEIDSSADVVIDFSTPEGAEKAIRFCAQHKKPLVMATTGLEPEIIELLKNSSHEFPVVWAPSMSLAVNLMMKVTEFVGTALKDHASGVDVEIIERHHRFKVDSPSGTALKFGQIAADAMGISNHQHGREGILGQRPRDEVGYHAIRAGDDPGQHTILFGMMGETIELRVAASNRDCYALGALAAAKYVVQQQAGLFNMYDVLGLDN